MYTVPGVPLIAQTQSQTCWFAAAQMVIQWKRGRTRSTLSSHPDPSDVAALALRAWSNDSLPVRQLVTLAHRLGLREVPPISIKLEGIQNLLLAHGPLFTPLERHAVVIAGVNQSSRDLFEILVHDPSPINVGSKTWRSLDSFVWGDPRRGDDPRSTSPNLMASFLYHPDGFKAAAERARGWHPLRSRTTAGRGET